MKSSIIFVEGENDVTFFQEYLNTIQRLEVKSIKIVEATQEIRRLSSGALLIDSGGWDMMYKGAIRLFRQIINLREALSHRILLIGDSYRVSPQGFAEKLSKFVNTSSKTHTLKFDVECSDNNIKLIEMIKRRSAVKAQVHLVPDSLERQILEGIKSKLGYSTTERNGLFLAAKYANFDSVSELIKTSVNWFLDKKWLKDIGDKLKQS